MTGYQLPNKTEAEVKEEQTRIENAAKDLLESLKRFTMQNLDLLEKINIEKSKKFENSKPR